VVAALSVTSDLTRGNPAGEAMCACLLASEFAHRGGLDEAARRNVDYATLLRFAGCAATSHEIAAALGGDDIAVRAPLFAVDWGKCAASTSSSATPSLSPPSGRNDRPR
jgi:hypothetical protein